MSATETQDVNILLLGETGVGKSTFINAFVNYLQTEDFENALTKDAIILIPTLATVMDAEGSLIEIREGTADDNEVQEVGASATQDVKTYVFPIPEKNILIRLIDSPGMGDTRGLDVDNDNCEHIFTYLSQLKELHGICFLMKPTNTRSTVFFEYCLKQILSRLDSSACANIIFVFTNTRGTDYTPGDTLPCLQKIINELEANSSHVKIPLKQNIFCLDNEPFKTWIAVRKGHQVKDRLLKGCRESWDVSSKECKRLFAYILGENENFPLQPHQLQTTTSVNEARRLILQLSKPSADISQLIDDNIRTLGKHKYDLNQENQSLNELKSKLYIPVMNIETEKLTEPRTVCTSSSCMDVIT
ncbi:Septin domain containing protein, partial [Asbolus verrucosus]